RYIMKYVLLIIMILLSIRAESQEARYDIKPEQEKQVTNQNSANLHPTVISDKMLQVMISELSNSTFTTFDELFDTSQLAPYHYIGYFEHISNNITNYTSPIHKGQVIAYTNQYGILFFNDEEILFTLDDLQEVPYEILIGENLFTGATNKYNEIIQHVLPISNINSIIQIFNDSLTYKNDPVILEKIMYAMGIEYDWVTTYFYKTPNTYYNNQIIWFTDEFNSVLDNKVKTHMLYNILTISKNPSIAFINGWLYFILDSFTPYYYTDESSTKLLMSDEALSK
ncbi:MAG: hypothetical protein ACRC0X_07550, partial [Brevinema sp.]